MQGGAIKKDTHLSDIPNYRYVPFHIILNLV